MDLMTFGGEQKLNTYIYAPKDDPYHRKHWRDLYPEDKAREIAELAASGRANNLSFVWSIHPGDTIDLTSEADFQSAIAKLEQLYTLGVRQFGILFDDIACLPDGELQASFINRIHTTFIKAKEDIKPLLTVGTRYCEAWGPSMSGYFKPFVETLHKDIEVLWTGAATMSNISREQYEAPKRYFDTDRKLSVWWNYPVNDYCDAKLLMGKIENLSADLDNVNGFFANPMNQPQASKQALFCTADHNWNTDAYDPDTSFSASFRAIAPEVAEDLEIVASNLCYNLCDGGASGEFFFDESWALKDDVNEIRAGLEQGKDISTAVESLHVHIDRIEMAVTHVREQCTHVKLVNELSPFLEALQLLVQAVRHALNGISAMKVSDLLAVEQHHTAAEGLLNDMEQCKVKRLKDEVPRDYTVEVGTYVILPFVKDMLDLMRFEASKGI